MADTAPEMAAAPRLAIWPALVRWAKRVSTALAALTAAAGIVYAVARMTVASERKEADMAETMRVVTSMSERLARMEARVETIINLVRPTIKEP